MGLHQLGIKKYRKECGESRIKIKREDNQHMNVKGHTNK